MSSSAGPLKRPRAWPPTLAWGAAAAAMALVVIFKLQVSFDLSAFFPNNADLGARVLQQQLSSGPGSRMLVIGINGGRRADRVETGRLLRQRLAEDAEFATVFNGEFELDSASIPEPVNSAYPLMADLDYSTDALRRALLERVANLAFGGGQALRTLFARDPYLASLEVMRRLTPAASNGSPWVAADGSAVLTAQTRAPGTDLEAQSVALEAVRGAFSEARTDPALTLDVTGVGAFGLELQTIIRKEAQWLGLLAGAAIFLVLLTVYRSVRLALIAGLPLALGYLAGMAAVALAFDTVHGITLAFGFTLLGVAVDYPLHLFSHARGEGGGDAIRSIWPTLRLGAASTATAYLAMVFSGSQGLSQLGLFTACGVGVAVLVTRTWLPSLLPAGQAGEKAPARQGPAHESRLAYVPAAIAVALSGAAFLVLAGDGPWNDRMDTLSPVPAERLQADQRLRAATESADLRYQVMIEADRLDALLVESEKVDETLREAVAQGRLEGWTSITSLLPSRDTQAARLEAIPEADALAANLRTALADTAFQANAFTPFLNVVNGASGQFPLTPESFDGTPLESWRDAHLLDVSGRHVALVTLNAPVVESLAAAIEEAGDGVHWVDLQAASNNLMRDFRHNAGWAVAVAALLIVALLVLQRIGMGRLAWVALTVTAALSLTICVVLLVQGFLTLVHMVALLLVLGLGLDYALFFSRREPPDSRKATVQSILACAASTTAAFSILAASSIPLLRFIGLTVAAGALANLALAWFASRRKPAAAS